jgi:hypothetical protein
VGASGVRVEELSSVGSPFLVCVCCATPVVCGLSSCTNGAGHIAIADSATLASLSGTISFCCLSGIFCANISFVSVLVQAGHKMWAVYRKFNSASRCISIKQIYFEVLKKLTNKFTWTSS